MPNILINPNSGIIEFSTGVAGGAIFEQNITSGNRAVRFGYDNFGGINITSYVNITGSGFASGQDRFSVDGANGRLFSVTDNLAGSLFSVNDIAGLPIIEAFDDNTVIMGAYNKNDFVLTGNALGLGGLPNTGTTKLYVSGNTILNSSIPSGSNPIPILTLSGLWEDNTKIFTGIYLNIRDSGSNSSSNLMDLQVGGTSQLSISKDGFLTSKGLNASYSNFSFRLGTNGAFVGRDGQYSANLAGTNHKIILRSVGALSWSSSSNLDQYAGDTYLYRDAAGIIAQQNGINPQQFRIYNITGTNIGEFALLGWINSGFIIGPQQTQSGVLRDLTLTGRNININASGVTNFNSRPTVNNTGILLSGEAYSNNNPSGFITNSSISKIIDKFTASSNQPPATGFATLDTRSSVLVLDYDDTVNESGTFVGMIPETAGLITGLRVRILWTATTATGDNCRWGARFADLTSSGIDAPFAIATEVNSTANSINGRSSTADIVCSGTAGLAANEFYRLLVYRNSVDTANDTMAGDAELISVTTYLV